MATSESSVRHDADFWAGQMAAVAQLRDRESFLRIYDYFMPRLCLYLRGLGSPDAVSEELAQEALLRLWQRADRYDGERGNVATWLFVIARNLHIDRVRKEPLWIDPAAIDAFIEVDSDFESSAESFTDGARFQARVDCLPALPARLIRMSYFEAKSHREIADELAMPLGTVKSILRRAFLQLQRSMRGSP